MSLFLLALIAAVLNLILGFLWHGPIFGRAYGTAMGMNMDNVVMDAAAKRGMYIRMAINTVAGYLMAAVTFLFLFNFRAMSLGDTFMILGVIFLGFTLPHIIVTNLWNGRPAKDAFKLFGISFGYQIINFVIWALIFVWLA
jgi:hypothetical protein